MYLFMWKKGGGVHLYMYMYGNTVSLYYRTPWWIFTKLGSDEVIMAPRMCLGFSSKSAQGGSRAGQE